jgi:hypothetical protein
MSRSLVSRCPTCGAKARIESSKEMSSTLKQLYMSCSNTVCGHTWVSNLEYSHTLSPSSLSIPENTIELLRVTSPTQQAELFSPLGAIDERNKVRHVQ